MAGLKSSPERIASLRAQLGLDKPVLEQLWIFVKQVFTLDWGKSWTTNEAISNIFATRLPATLPSRLGRKAACAIPTCAACTRALAHASCVRGL